MIPTYNCARYLAKSLASVMSQAPAVETMQIEVIDDFSTQDDPEAVVAELGRGRVGFYRQPQNLGNTANFNTCLQRSQGELIHLLHDDDCVRKGFYQQMQHCFEDNPQIGAAFCRYISMDEADRWQVISPLLQSESGVLHDWLERIAVGQLLQTPSMVVRRDVYEQLGGFDSRLSYCEDWEMWVRIAAHYPVWYEIKPLAVYRVRSTSVSGRSVRSGKNGSDIRRAIEINHACLPGPRACEISQKARENFSLACLRRARRLFYAGERRAAFAQAKEAIRSRISMRVLIAILCLCTAITANVSGLSRFISDEA